MARSAHKRSRHGCRQCKVRHVKCDEQGPCSNCVRHGVDCSLKQTRQFCEIRPREPMLTPTPIPERSNATSSTPPQYNSDTPTSQNSGWQQPTNVTLTQQPESNPLDPVPLPRQPRRQLLPQNIALGGSSRIQEGSDEIQLRTPFLFHHYCSSVYQTLAKCQVWQKVVPQLALEHVRGLTLNNKQPQISANVRPQDFCMNSLLAISAAHLAYLNEEAAPKRHFNSLALRYQSQAVTSFSTTLDDVSEENSGAYLATATMVFLVNTFWTANPFSTGEQDITLHSLVHVFKLLEGVRIILSLPSIGQAAKEGPLAAIYEDPQMATNLEGEFMEEVKDLTVFINDVSSNIGFPENLPIYSSAIDALTLTYSFLLANSDRPDRIWTWPWAVPQEFLSLIEAADPIALLILAYYTTLVHSCEDRLWYIEGWSDRVLQLVFRTLDESWKGKLEWPARCLRQRVNILRGDQI
ncbi:uncharacterized protein K452DRAFT_356577 [Aplosporella prunicola CBS 121167]|uniref:Zn(2)-C6 fungal-type domain-containing protein n=1 Tax=Aplosporella prunicola CBS 121167 TaxID=1176127 RepID=A0A6A6BJR3_9PEZI|nr:uncharacterized protein K452DRAFT_356577 [Aplosporella prunicola CBS 121167]KAF2144362.1 hypothetical protein K452DRAFT_356577 [Aplosporella prunicola CBS 121167]